MKKLKTSVLLALAAVSLSACMPIISKQGCMTTNWYQRGVNDGSRGASANIAPFAEQCAKYHININTNTYYQGWRRSIRSFCTYNKGLSYGRNGRGIPSGCAGSAGQRFYQGWQEGLRNFCSYSKGLALGEAGKGAPSICHGAVAGEFNRGYQTGSRRFCSNLNAGYSAGRNGLPYPSACSADQFPAFYNAYQNGLAYHNRTSGYQSRLDSINSRISDLISRYQYHENADGTYRLSSHHNTVNAKRHLVELNRLLRDRAILEHKIYKQNVRHRRNWDPNYNGGGNDGPIVININR